MVIFTPFIKKTITIVNVFSIIASQALFASQIVIDTTQTNINPTLTQSDNNIDIVNIAKPNQAGISNNFYHEFNVGQDGAILNNILAQEALGNTQLAGFINSNPNLDSATARLILNQVTGGNLSQLLGYLEIAGSKADMLLANPNGITCQGCGFINAGNVTLSTGSLSKEELERLNSLKEYTNSTPIFLNIKRGDIIVEALDAKNVASLTLLAKSMSVKDSLQAQNLRILLGSNQVSFSPVALLYKPIKLDNNETENALALDVAYLGSILSNKIFIVATDEGVGIRNSGMIASTASQNNGDNGFVLRADGKIEISKPIDITTISQVQNGQNTDILLDTENADKEDTKKQFAPLIYSESNIDIQAGSIENNSIIHAQNDIYLKADTILNKGFADIEKKVITTEKFNSWHPTINNVQKPSDSQYKYTIVTSQEYINEATYSPSILLGRNITIEAEDFTNDTGIIHAKDSFKNYATNFTNIAPELREIVSYENGKATTYNRYGKCVWLLEHISQDWFCSSTYTTSKFTRANEYTLLDFVAPNPSLNTIEINSINSLLTALDSSSSLQAPLYQNHYGKFILSEGFQNHLKSLHFTTIDEIQDYLYITPKNSLAEINDKSLFSQTKYKEKLQNLNSKDIALQSGISANNIHIDSQNILNSSKLSSDKNMMVNADFIINENGKIVSMEGLNLNAESFTQNGGKLKGNEVNITAKDVNISSSTISNSANQVGYRSDIWSYLTGKSQSPLAQYTESTSSNTTLGSLASIEGNAISINANNTHITGANLNAQESVLLKSDTLTIDTLATHNNYSDSVATYKSTTNIGSSIKGNNVLLETTGDMNLISTNIEAKDTLALNAGQNITIDTAKDTSFSQTQTTTTTSEFLSKTTTTEVTKDSQSTNLASNFSGNAISINANNDINAYNLNANADSVTMNADGDLLLSNRADTHNIITDTKIETSGLKFSKDDGYYRMSVGKDTTKIHENQTANTHNNASINANNITMNAGESLAIQSSDLNADSTNGTLALSGKDVSIESLDNEITTKTTTDFTSNRFGIGFEVKGVDKAVETIKENLGKAAVGSIDLASELKSQDISIGLKAGFTHINRTTTENIFDTTASSPNLTGGNITIASNNDTNIIGSNLKGNDIALSGENVNISAKEQKNQNNTQESEHTVEVSIGIGAGTKAQDTGVSLTAGYGYKNENKDTNTTANKSSHIESNNLSINAKNNASIKGSNIDTNNAEITATSFELADATNTSETDIDKHNFDIGAKLTYNGGYDFGMDTSYKYNGTNETNASSHSSNFNANNLKLTTTGDTTITGSNLSVKDTADIQTNNFNVASATHEQTKNNHSGGANAGFGIGASGFSMSLGGNYDLLISKDTTNTQSNLQLGSLNLTTTGDTTITGSNFIVKNDANIHTNNFTLKNETDTINSHTGSIKANIGYDGSETSLGGSLKYDGLDAKSNVASNMYANNLNLVAKGDTTIIGSNLVAKDNATIQTDNMKILSVKYSGYDIGIDSSGEMVVPWDGSKAHGLTHANYHWTPKYVGSSVSANNLTLNVNNDTTLQGSSINANNASITTNTLNIESTQDKSVAIGFKPDFDSVTLHDTERDTYISLDASYKATNNNAAINSNNLSINTKSDVNINGGNINSYTLNANIGGNLNITSKKDSRYGAGFDIAVGTTENLKSYQNMTGSGYFGHENGVNSQSGIASNFINMIAGNINLKGAYIEGNSGNITANSVSSSDTVNSSSHTLFTQDTIILPEPNLSVTHSSISKNINLDTKIDSYVNRSDRDHTEIANIETLGKWNDFKYDPEKTIKKEIKDFTQRTIDNAVDTAVNKVVEHLPQDSNQ